MVAVLFAGGRLGAQPDRLDAGERLFESQRYREAIEDLEGAVREDPASARAVALLGRALFEENILPRAVECLERATALDPASSTAFYWLGRAYGRQAVNGNVLLRAKLAGRVRRAFERAADLDPDNVNARIALVEFYLRAPGFMGGSFEKARAISDDLKRRDPLRAHLAKARLEEHRKRRDLEDAQYESAIREFPSRPEPYFWIERSAVDRRDWPAAFEAMATLVRIEPGNSEALYEIGRIAALSGTELDRGEASLRRYLERAPRDDEPTLAEAHLRLAEIAERRGARGDARREYAAALEVDPGVAGARQALARMGGRR